MFYCMRIYGTTVRSATLAPAYPTSRLAVIETASSVEISSPGAEGFSSFHSILFLHVAADTPPVRTCCFRLFRQALFAFARYRPSQPPELKCYEATPTFIAHYNLEFARTPKEHVVRGLHRFAFALTVPLRLREGSLFLPVGLSPTRRYVLIWTRQSSILTFLLLLSLKYYSF